MSTMVPMVGEAAGAREKTEMKKFGDLAATNGMKFVPLVFETGLGYVTDEIMALVKKLAERIAEKSNSHYSVVLHYWCPIFYQSSKR